MSQENAFEMDATKAKSRKKLKKMHILQPHVE